MQLAAILLLASPLASAQLNKLAQAAGKHYFGTATDSIEFNNTHYVKILSDTDEFGQITPSNGQKWMYVEPEQGVFNYTYGEETTKLARKNGNLLPQSTSRLIANNTIRSNSPLSQSGLALAARTMGRRLEWHP